jgi:hypothetical protein
MTAVGRLRAVLLAELLTAAEARRAHRRRMVVAFAIGAAGQLARVIAAETRAFGDGAPPAAWWTTLAIASIALGFAAFELRATRAIERRMGALGKTLARLV